MPLSKNIEDIILFNALGETNNLTLIEYIKSNLDNIPKDIRIKHQIQFNRLDKNDLKAQILIINLIFGAYINLKNLENYRLIQMQKETEHFIPIKHVIEEMEWLSGGLTLKYLGVDNLEHHIHLNFPFNKKLIITYNLIGALYLDHKLVPIRSTLEHEIKNALSHFISLNHHVTTKQILDYVSSKAYIYNAKEIGRI